MNIRVIGVAQTEFAEASDWYDGQSAGLGREFEEEVEGAFGRMRRFPFAWK